MFISNSLVANYLLTNEVKVNYSYTRPDDNMRHRPKPVYRRQKIVLLLQKKKKIVSIKKYETSV